ncbi:serine/threonine-protein kinase MRCK alpha-like isoform X1 [Tachypleus tridentatus]|uniref:serine/threonine-protein kinase MRCK alpha-like isoform X1 n=1 Tax=Tachypleus tridentatus TaxID=6853 RepID=UPI003FD13869
MAPGPEERIKQVEKLFLDGCFTANGTSYNIEILLDVLLVLYDECCNSSLRREKTFSQFVEHVKPLVQRIKSFKLLKEDFEVLKVIGRGAFGEVSVVKQKDTKKVYAMKTLNKWEMLKRAETACFQEERDVLINGDKRWITNLHYAFQDENNLYLVMDYYSGGDLLTLLSKYEDRLPEEMTKFYMGEMILAIDAIHKQKYVHRDIKPDNILLGTDGHIRLADFGSCLRLLDDGTVQSNVAVGTPDYISPEILRAMEDGQGKYGPECDWWSLGVCMFEMLYGETPFYAESLVETYGKIMSHKTCFAIPDDPTVTVSDDAKDLMKKLICGADCRLGQNGIDDFKQHPWFKGIDWDNIRDGPAPYVPDVSSPTDTSNFDDLDELDQRSNDSVPPTGNSVFSGLHLPFVGFTFTCGSKLSGVGYMMNGDDVRNSSSVEPHNVVQDLRQEKAKLSKEIKELTLELQRNKHSSLRFKKELDVLGQEDLLDGEMSSYVKELEKNMHQIKIENEDLQKELTETKEKLKQQVKELKDAISQRKSALADFTDVSDKLSELRAQKQKLSRQVREKEEELDSSKQKIDSLRQELRKAEKLRREFESQIDDGKTETNKERRMRERTEEHLKEIQAELESLKKKQTGRLVTTVNSETTQEISRLKEELQTMKQQHEEVVSQKQARFKADISNMKDLLQETETTNISLQKEILTLKEKIEQARSESATEIQEIINDMKQSFEHEKLILQEENKKLTQEKEILTTNIRKEQETKKNLEAEFAELKEKKDAIAQWEAQINEIVQWVKDEKDARGYLQTLANKMSEELEYLKTTGVPPTPTGTVEKNWKNRRSQKMEKMEILNLQSNLHSEIQAKQAISQELSRVRGDYMAQQKELEESRQKEEMYREEMQKKDAQIKELEMKLDRLDLGDGFLDRPSSQMSFLDQFLKDTSLRLGCSDSGEYAEVGEETDNEFHMPTSFSGSKSTASETSMDQLSVSLSPVVDSRPTISSLTPQPKAHQFMFRNLGTPLKCYQCTSLLVGLYHQGVVCEVCGFVCHVTCQHTVPAVCPVPANQIRRPAGIDLTKGVGTACDGFVKVPKPLGVKKGWIRQFLVVCDFKLFLYDLVQDKNPGVSVSQVLDMRDEEFMVSSVLEADVIHANKKDVPCIFKVTTSLLDYPNTKNHTLIMVEKEADKRKWVDLLSELHRVLRRNNLPCQKVYEVKEIFDSTMAVTKNILSLAVIDQDRVVLGTEEGLYCMDLDRDEMAKIGDGKKVSQIEYIEDEQLLIVITAKQRQLRLIPVGALDGHEVEWIKVPDTKGCVTFCVSSLEAVDRATGLHYYFTAAVKRQLTIYEITRMKVRHQKYKEIQLPGQPQCLDVFGEKICVGVSCNFYLYSLEDDSGPTCMIPLDSIEFAFLRHSPMDALLSAELPNNEYLLVFSQLGVYVNKDGVKSREKELMFTASPTAVSFRSQYLSMYSETHVDIFDVILGNWIQTVNIPKSKPLSRTGEVVSTCTSDLPQVLYFHNIQDEENLIHVPDPNIQGQQTGSGKISITRMRRKFSARDPNRIVDRKSRIISGPTNFNHVSHMGPGEFHNLSALPTAQESIHKVKHMFYQGKSTPLRSQSRDGLPQRPISVASTIQNGNYHAAQTPRPVSTMVSVSPDDCHVSEEQTFSNSLINEILGDSSSSPHLSRGSNFNSSASPGDQPWILDDRDFLHSSYESQS